VLVSSQTWSTDGTLYNRDAGVIIDNEAAAKYFQQIFMHDWQHLAVQKANSASHPGPKAAVQAAGGAPNAVEIASSAWFSASLICLPPIPRKPPSL
jgi:hypothetical protein